MNPTTNQPDHNPTISRRANYLLGRTTDGMVTIDDVRWITTSRSSLLPQGLAGVIPGTCWLAT